MTALNSTSSYKQRIAGQGKDAYLPQKPRFSNTRALLLALMLVLLLGVLFGTLTFRGTDSGLSFITNSFIKDRAEQTFIQTFANSFCGAGALALLCFFLGFSALAQPIELLVPLFRGLGLGTTIAFIYSSYGVKGFAITLVLIIPHAVISSMAIIIAAREGLRLSNLFTGFAIGEKSALDFPIKKSIKLYLLKFVILFVIIGLSSLLDSILTFLFAGVLC